MSYIYDSFPSNYHALQFAAQAASARGSDNGDAVQFFNTPDDANAHDPFPYELHPPIVHVERDDGDSLEDYLRTAAEALGGKYAGT